MGEATVVFDVKKGKRHSQLTAYGSTFFIKINVLFTLKTLFLFENMMNFHQEFYIQTFNSQSFLIRALIHTYMIDYTIDQEKNTLKYVINIIPILSGLAVASFLAFSGFASLVLASAPSGSALVAPDDA